MEEMQPQKSLGHNFLFTIILTAIIGLVNYGYPLVVGLIYGAEILASYSVPYYWASILTIPIINGIAPAVTRFLAANSYEKTGRFESEGAKLTSIYVILPLLIFPFIGVFVLDFTVLEIFFILLLIFLMAYHYLIRKSYQGQEKYTQLIKIESISFVVFIPFMIVFGILPGILEWESLTFNIILFLPVVIYHLIFNIIILFNRFREISFHNFFKFSSITKRILRYSFFIGFGDLLTVGISQSQIIISNSFLADFEVGVLSFINSAIMPITLLSVSLAFMLLPRVTNLELSESKRGVSFVNSLNWGFSLVFLPLAGLLFLLFGSFPNVLDTITLSKFEMTANWLALVLLAYQVVSNLLSVPSLSYIASSERSVLLRMVNAFIYTVAIIISWIFLVPLYGIFGFAAGSFIGGFVSMVTVQIMTLVLTKRKAGWHIFFLIGGTGLNAGFIVLLSYSSNILLICLWSVLTVALVAFGSYILFKVQKNEEYSIRYNTIENGIGEV